MRKRAWAACRSRPFAYHPAADHKKQRSRLSMYLGLDIGTSAVKAVLTEQGRVVADASAPLPISRPQPLWSEQDPADWWQAAQAAILALPADQRRAVRGVGLAGQMHGAVLLDACDKVLRPAILWNDGRSSAECDRLSECERITGNLAMPGFTAPKLLWVQTHERDIFRATAKILLPKDYIRLLLTGDYASDMSDSAGTLWLNVAERRWSERMLAATGLDISHMPRLFEGNQASGMLSASVASALGLPIVPVAAGGGDNAAGAVGAGVAAPGDAFLSLGTSGVIFAVSDGFAPNTQRAVHAFCHALPDTWHQMSVILSAASCLDWVARLGGFVDVPQALAAAETATGTPPIFLPYLSGERTPHNDPGALGVFYGLTHDSDRALLVRSVLEGVAFALADGADALRDAGTMINRMSVIGGGARSMLWGQIIASALNVSLEYRADATIGPAFGAARLAQMAVEGGSDCAKPALLESIDPDPALALALTERHAIFRKLYSLLTPLSRNQS
jgi:xylulokinase